MRKLYFKNIILNLPIVIISLLLMLSIDMKAQSLTSPQVNFTQRTSSATPGTTVYNLKGDFTMLGNTNLTLTNYNNTTNNEGNSMKYVDIDGDSNTLNSSMATLELSNSGENSSSQNCSKIVYAGLYWTGKSNDNNETFSVTKGSVTKNYDKKVISIKGPGAAAYTAITAKPKAPDYDIRFPGSAQSGIFIGYQEITDYVKTYGPGAYTVADIALIEGTNNNPGYSGGWVMIVIYENSAMKSRAVTLFDGYAYVNGQRSGGGEYGTIPISGFTTVGAGPVNMKLGVMAAEGDVATNSGSDYLAVLKLNADPNVYNATNYLTLNHAGNTTNNFFNSSIFPVPAAGKSNPILQNNTGVDFSMFTVPNAGNTVIGNNQTSTTFRFGSTYEVYTIFGFAMSVDTYIPEPEGFMAINSINAVTTPPQPYSVLPGQEISYTLNIKNKGTEAINNNIVTIPISNTINFIVGSINSTKDATVTTTNLPYYDNTSHSIIWDMGTLPLPADQNTLLATITFKVKATEDCAIIVNNSCNSVISVSGTINGTGAVSGVAVNKAIFKGFDNTSGCQVPITAPTTVTLDNSGSPCFTALAGPDQVVSCGGEIVNLAATSGTSGTWSIVSGPAGGGEVFSNNTSTNSTFYSPNVGNYLLRWTTSCAGTKDDVLVTFVNCNILNFDGIDDNVTFKNNYGLNTGSFSIETWVKSNTTNGNKQTILSKRLGTSTADGYDLKLVNNIISFNWNNGNTIASNFTINTDRWYHVAVTFNGSNYKLYIDGIPVQNAVSGVNPILNNSANCILGAMDQGSGIPFNYFNGWMDELRIWKVELTVDQIRQMMNQEIQNNGGNVKGAIVPLDIPGLTWTNLDGYYPMNPVNDVVNGFVVGKSTSAINGKLRNIGTQQPDTAPLPYTSRISNQDWSQDDTWTYYDVWDVPNSLAIDGTTRIDWNIVKTSHYITSKGNKTVLGLLVNSNTISAENDSKIQVSKYLKLNGKIDLVGKSQLIQTEGSILDVTSSGSLERDQQGQSNKYNYNYWSSPVSPINTTANNTDYTVGGVLKDGTNAATPTAINWVGGYDGSPTSPISLARYWVYKFDNYANAYANWVQIGETGSLRVGQGFTLKGSGGAGATQNYTFIGKPNNGTIATNTVSSDQLLLTGNPYPSALDADAFITDNSASIDGTLYFWEHYTTNNTHILRDYEGGYAERNLTGGVPPTSVGVDYISGLGTTTRSIPNRYIPVGQSFFVNGKIGSTATTVTYKNSQRGFIKENESTSNLMFKTKPGKDKYWNNNESDKAEKKNYKKIRLGFDSNNTAHRQTLLGFMDEKATIEMDYGYDGLNFDEYPNDMYFMCGENQLVIQGVGSFDKNSSYPIGVKSDTEGKVVFMIDSLENFDKNQNIFIYDNSNNTYHDIKNKNFEVMIPIGEYNDRFSLRFTDKTLSTNNSNNNIDLEVDSINIIHFPKRNSIEIYNNSDHTIIKKVTLYNVSGQSIINWDIENQNRQNIQLPVKKISSGIYIVKIKTSDGEISKKIIVP
ncbi:LamG-like jellyroll fold domain-containing protein [Flavobacterium sp. WC2430]|uniref:LamG-like jellyroll fold domain-containing protein n=1 Tax=Flavobacterium sp. WC2430 TaxID=3234137 RepID=UPI003467B1E3